MKQIFSTIIERIEQKQDLILAAIISRKGSAPRGDGAMMVIDPLGLAAGTIGGGSAEHEAIQYAMSLIGKRKSDIHEYMLRHNDQEDIGMICGGNITVFFQFIDSSDPEWQVLASSILSCIENRIPGYFNLFSDFSIPALSDTPTASSDQRQVLFSSPLPIGERVFIFGAGHCALALAPLLHKVGFRITVMDNRPETVTAERYPEAEHRICGDFERLSDYIEINSEDYVVIMTSGHANDYIIEKQVLSGSFTYLGIIGSKLKTASINKKLLNDGFSADLINSVHTPIGIPIQAQTPEEIAVSITAEMIHIRALHRNALDCKLTACPMHAIDA